MKAANYDDLFLSSLRFSINALCEKDIESNFVINIISFVSMI